MKKLSRRYIHEPHRPPDKKEKLKEEDYVWSKINDCFLLKRFSVQSEHDSDNGQWALPHQVFSCEICGKQGIVGSATRVSSRNAERIMTVDRSCVKHQNVWLYPGHERIIDDMEMEPAYLSRTLKNAYHHGGRHIDNSSIEFPFRIGFEIEKEDADVAHKIASNAYEKTLPSGWVIESDGSLNSTIGFELITRAYNLRWIKGLERDIELASELIDANFSIKCGGHIHISDARYTNDQLLNRIAPWIPLFMTLYARRTIKNNHCTPSLAKYPKDSGTKHHTVILHRSGTVEIRAFTAVRNRKNMLWRIRLIEMMLNSVKEEAMSFVRMKDMLGPKGELRELLLQTYTREEFLIRQDFYWRFADFYMSKEPVSKESHPFTSKLFKCA